MRFKFVVIGTDWDALPDDCRVRDREWDDGPDDNRDDDVFMRERISSWQTATEMLKLWFTIKT